MDRNDWTPAVLITATVCLMTAGLVWLVAPWGPRRARDAGETIPRRGYQHEVVVWTGEVAPGLKGVLGPVWGDPKPDRDHDGILNRDLGLEGANALAYFRLLVFNTSNEPRVLELGNGRLVMTGEDGARSLPLRSLAAMVTAGEVTVDARLRFTLHSLGALSPRLEIPPGEFVKLVVPFAGDARIERARTIVTAQGTVLRRVELARAVFRHLMESPDEARVKDL